MLFMVDSLADLPKKRGRRPAPAPRTVGIHALVSLDEREAAIQAAARNGQTLSAFARGAILERLARVGGAQ
jgi:hypothetical protein